jgi:hypothetical protein
MNEAVPDIDIRAGSDRTSERSKKNPKRISISGREVTGLRDDRRKIQKYSPPKLPMIQDWRICR